MSISDHAIRLNKNFDPLALEAAYTLIKDTESVAAGYPGEGHAAWNSILLYSAASLRSDLWDGSYFQQVLDNLNLKIRLARILSLDPGGFIRKHQDSFLSNLIVRLHIPIVTHPDVEFYIAGTRCSWNAGEFWYGDFSQPHSGINKSDIKRAHLVLDVIADECLLALFPVNKIPQKLATNVYSKTEYEIDNELLKRFIFDFTLPAGFQIPGTIYQKLDEALLGSIRLVDSELCVFINEQPLLKAIPMSEDILELIGLGTEARLECAFIYHNVRNVDLIIGTNGVRIPVAVLYGN